MQFNVYNFLTRIDNKSQFVKVVFYDEKKIKQCYTYSDYGCYCYYRIEHWEIKNKVLYLHVIPNNKKRVRDIRDWALYLFYRSVFEKIVECENAYSLYEIEHAVRNSQNIFSNIKLGV